MRSVRIAAEMDKFNELVTTTTTLCVRSRSEIIICLPAQVNRYGYPYFHCNFSQYGCLRSEIARKWTVFARNIGHSNTAPYTYRNLIMIGPYFCARYYGRIWAVSFHLRVLWKISEPSVRCEPRVVADICLKKRKHISVQTNKNEQI